MAYPARSAEDWTLRAVRGRRSQQNGAGNQNAGFPCRDRPRTAHHLRTQRQVGLHSAKRHGESRLGHVLDTARCTAASASKWSARYPAAGRLLLNLCRSHNRPAYRTGRVCCPAGAPDRVIAHQVVEPVEGSGVPRLDEGSYHGLVCLCRHDGLLTSGEPTGRKRSYVKDARADLEVRELLAPGPHP
jgi:hypothetical protein